MKVIILASGRGERLYPLTKNKPKPLIKVGGRELLDHQMKSLIEYGLENIIITTGPFEDQIHEYVEKNYPYVNIRYVKNPKYLSTNYIYSMWLTKKFIDDDVILLHCDLLFDKSLMKKLISKEGNHVLVNKKVELPDKDFKAVIKDGRVVKIGVEFYGENTFACFPMYKFSEKDFLIWLNEIEKYVKRGKVNIYSEDVLNTILHRVLLYPLYFSDKLCMEIDTKEDMEIAENILGGRSGREGSNRISHGIKRNS